jgi:energy-coupling factor transport system ATP-binding protein
LRHDIIQQIHSHAPAEPLAQTAPAAPPAACDPIIRIKNLTHIYNPSSVYEKTAIDNISIDINKGEMIGLIGHTGSGKSTLIQHINALLKPSDGTVCIDGEDIFAHKKELKKLRQRVGLVFQYPEHQLFEASVYKDVAFGPIRMGLSRDEVDERVLSALKLVGITPDLHDKSPFDLSGGQKRRVAVAGVLAMRPDILILDEPAAGLDPAGRQEILSHIKHMHEQMGNTIILVSHSMEDAARLASRVIVLNRGRVALDGTPSEVFTRHEQLRQIGLAAPQISVLMDALHKRDAAIPADVFTVKKAAVVLGQYLKEEKP